MGSNMGLVDVFAGCRTDCDWKISLALDGTELAWKWKYVLFSGARVGNLVLY